MNEILTSLWFVALGAGMTALLTFGAAAIGILLAVPLVMMVRSTFTPFKVLYYTIVHIVRGVPSLVWLFIAFFGLTQVGIRLEPFTSAIITLSVIATARMAEVYRGGFQAVPESQWEAARSLSLSGFHTGLDVIAPQVFRAVSPSVATQVIGLLKDSALVATIGVSDLVFRATLMTESTGNGLLMFGFAGLIYLALSLPIGIFSRHIHSRLMERYVVV